MPWALIPLTASKDSKNHGPGMLFGKSMTRQVGIAAQLQQLVCQSPFQKTMQLDRAVASQRNGIILQYFKVTAPPTVRIVSVLQ
jgi:hypothetical protein